MTTFPPDPDADAVSDDDEPGTDLERTRFGGQFEAGLAEAERNADAAAMRAKGMSYRAIGKAQGVSHTAARNRVQAALAAVQAEAVGELREVSSARLNSLMVQAFKVLAKEHPMVSHGRIIPNVEDVGPKLAAIREIRLLDESLRKLYGTDAPTQVRVRVDPRVQQEILELTAILEAELPGESPDDDSDLAD